MGKIGMIVV